MQMLKRIGYFLITNILVMLTISVAFNLIVQFMGLNQLNSYYGFILVWSAVWGMGGAFISLLMSKWMAKRFHGVQVIEPRSPHPDLNWLYGKVEDLARAARLPKTPEVGIYESPDVNAFATGPSKSNALVAVSTGLLQRMNKEEIEGVLAHEVAHIANGDMVTMTLIQGVVNAFVLFFSRIIANIIASSVESKNRHWIEWLVYMVAQVVFSIFGSIVVNYFSRQREYRADAGAGVYSSKQNMISALYKLKSIYENPSLAEGESDDEGAMATLMIASRKPTGFAALFKTHPDLDDRIMALQNKI